MLQVLIALLALALLGVPVAAQVQDTTEVAESQAMTAEPAAPAAASAPAPVSGPGEAVSLAERIARLERALEAGEAHLKALRSKLREQEQEYEAAGAEFKQVDSQLELQKQALQSAQTSGTAEDVQALETAVSGLEKKWQIARERFDLAISARKTAQEQIVQLEAKTAQDRQAMTKLIQPAVPPPSAEGRPTTPPQPAATSAAAAPVEVPVAPVATPADPAPTDAAAIAPVEATPSIGASASSAEAPPAAVLQAQTAAAQAEASAREAEVEVEAIVRRVQILDENIRLEQQARDAARKQGDNAEATLRQLGDELQNALDEGAGPAVVQDIRRKTVEAHSRLRAARAEVAERSSQLDKLQAERGALLSEQLLADHSLEQQRKRAEAAQRSLEAIQNPLAPHNVLRWLAEKGPKLTAVLLVAFGMHVLIKIVAGRIVAFITRNESSGTRVERQNRANTLVGVFHNTGIVVLYIGAVLMALDIAGIPIAPLLGGAAVVGLAVAFAAQNLIKDYFYGFMILMEDQYGVNDVVTIGGITGFVERITLRITVLRDLDAVHFIPHGQITTVSNLTHKWSRAVFDIGVSYKEDVDRVMEVLMDLGREIRTDPAYSKLILDDPEMLGVDSLGESAVVIKFFVKTKPLRQWTVKRELLRRIKNRFDELGIEIPFPHRTVYHRYADDADCPGERLASGGNG
ncbi:MAG: mechanosensitive ion channel [Thermoguttaceae bacterium]|nr:mechanosensitive ion channel [Thermoguttaceae bacterium]